MQWLYFFDIFSRKPKLKIKGQNRLQSIYVSILGIFVLFGFLIVASILTHNVVIKKTFNIIENSNSKTFSNYTFDTEILLSAVVSDLMGAELKNYSQIVEVKLKYFQFYIDSINYTTITTDIPRVNCTYKKLQGDIFDTYEKLFEVSKTLECFDLKPYNVNIFGEHSPGIPHGFLVFYLNQCTNTTEKNDCLPQKELDKQLKEIKMSVIFPNIDIDNRLSNPFVKFTDGKVFRFSNTLRTRYEFELETVDFLSDEGLIFEDVITHSTYQVGKYETLQYLSLGNRFYPGTFGNINFFGTGRKKTIQRSYIKIHSILPYLVSIYHIALILIKLIVNYFGGDSIDEYLFSSLIKNEDYEKFSEIKREIKYEDLFEKIQKPNEDQEHENLNFIANPNRESMDYNHYEEKIEGGIFNENYSAKKKTNEINFQHSSFQNNNSSSQKHDFSSQKNNSLSQKNNKELEEINGEKFNSKRKNSKKNTLRNNFFPNEEEKIQENQYQKIEENHEKKDSKNQSEVSKQNKKIDNSNDIILGTKKILNLYEIRKNQKEKE